MKKRTMKRSTLQKMFTLIKLRKGKYSSPIIGFLAHDETIQSEAMLLTQILESEAICVSYFYQLLGVTFNSVNTMELAATHDIGRITAMELKTTARSIFFNYSVGIYTNNPQLLRDHCQRICVLSGSPYVDIVIDVFCGYVSESSSVLDFIDKLFTYLFVHTSYKKIQRDALVQRLFDEIQKPIANPTHLASFAIGYLFQIGVSFHEHGDLRGRKDLIPKLEAIIVLARNWAYSGIECDSNFFNSIMVSFIENKGDIVKHAHWLQVARIIWYHSGKTKQGLIPGKIAEYELATGVTVVLSESLSVSELFRLHKIPFSHLVAQQELDHVLKIV